MAVVDRRQLSYGVSPMAATDVRTALAEQRQARQQRSWWSILKISASEWLDADAMTWAAAIACYTVLALAPLLVVAVKIGTIFLRGQGHVVDTIHEGVTKIMGTSQGADAIAAILDKVINQKGGVLASIVSGVIVIFSVGGVFAEIQQAMNRVWKLKVKPGHAMGTFIRARLKSVVVLIVAALVVLASLTIAGWLDRFTSHFGAAATFLVWAIDFIASWIALTLIFGMVFKTVPDAEIGWRTTIIGAVITAFLFAIGKYGLALYFKFGTPTSAFGAVGSLAAVLIWIYYSAQIVLFGAVITQVFSKLRGHGVKPSKHAQFLSECDETETATPSGEDPGSKPRRPTPHSRPGRPDPGYAAVLGQYAPASSRTRAGLAEMSPQQQMAARNLIAAGAGMAVGALIGGYGALHMRRAPAADPKRLAAARLQRRLDRVQQKIGHASRMKQFLEQDDVNERLDSIEAQIRAAAAKKRARVARPPAPAKWPDRIMHLVKSYL